MAFASVTMPDGRTWTPKFVGKINQEKCIGCGRCFRVCGRDVLQLVGVTEDGEFIPVVLGSDDDDDEESKICPKDCYSHAEMSAG
jgi:Nif-specific ferredoxin III